mmetsp:Transcript_46428/g.130754  ORF Transcript_46428/g.130754 Transcript_46428/m.130754 type:complete len:110 (+) Transcript_46428:159-488(+)
MKLLLTLIQVAMATLVVVSAAEPEEADGITPYHRFLQNAEKIVEEHFRPKRGPRGATTIEENEAYVARNLSYQEGMMMMSDGMGDGMGGMDGDSTKKPKEGGMMMGRRM